MPSATSAASPMTVRRPINGARAREPPQRRPRAKREALSSLRRGYHLRGAAWAIPAQALLVRRRRLSGAQAPGRVEAERRLAEDREITAPRHVGGERLGDFELAEHERVL